MQLKKVNEKKGVSRKLTNERYTNWAAVTHIEVIIRPESW